MRYLAKAILSSIFLSLLLIPVVGAGQENPQTTTYTIAEYNAYEAASAEKDPQSKIKLLDDFVSKFPNSTLLPNIYQLYYTTYAAQKNLQRTIESADKLIALGEKVEPDVRLRAILARLQAFSQLPPNPAPDAEQFTRQWDAALLGVKLLQALPKPVNPAMSNEDFAKQQRAGLALFYSAAANSSMQLKDYSESIRLLKALLMIKPDDAISAYTLGLAYLGITPPQTLDGFWSLARAVDLKVSQATKVKDYLRSQILAYERPGCDDEGDAQLNELLQLASTSPERPTTYKIPSQDDLNNIRQVSNILTVINDLAAGGDKAKMTWLAVCGAEFPDVAGKIIDERRSDASIDFMAYLGATSEDIQAAASPNMDVKVWIGANGAGNAQGTEKQSAPVQVQPEAARLSKGDAIRFSGALTSYDTSPLILHWSDVKIDPAIIPPAASRKVRAPSKIRE